MGVEECVLVDVVNDCILHQVLDAVPSSQGSTHLSGADLVGNPLRHDMNVPLQGWDIS